MQLLVITTVTEFEKDICNLFKKSQIDVYSTSNIQGQKFSPIKNMSDNWFSAHRDSLDSKLYFTFSSEEKIDIMLQNLEQYNAEHRTNNPAKAIVLPIEKFV
ncbi:MAG: hypothetical protein COB60_07745 [Flavobacteriaceae bacterium]|nr:MAG: hypothetical protein COB60_07745 [Flavobacteriaceae bacterium]